MCLPSCAHLSVEEAVGADESLLVYCKPVELYNILHHRAQHNPSFLRRCLHYRLQSSRKRRSRDGIVVFNYKDYDNLLQKTEVTEDFSCPFCLMRCANFKGLRCHLCSSHDLFNYEFWVTEDFQAVNVSVKIDILRCETIADGADLRQQTFFFCSKPRRRKPKNPIPDEKHVQFLELDSPNQARECTDKGSLENGEDDQSCKGEQASKSVLSENHFQYGKYGANKYGPDYRSSMECLEHVGSSFNVPGIAMAQSSVDAESLKSQSGTDLTHPATMHIAKTRKLSVERSDPKNRVLLQKRQFFHSHRVQPMALDQVLSERDSEDEVDDEIADFEDRRMLDDFVDVTKDEKHLMHLWNSFVRKQRVLADGHVPWACEAFSKLHGHTLFQSPALFWCWRLFMIKLWNHGLLDAGAMDNCNLILEGCRNVGEEGAMK